MGRREARRGSSGARPVRGTSLPRNTPHGLMARRARPPRAHAPPTHVRLARRPPAAARRVRRLRARRRGMCLARRAPAAARLVRRLPFSLLARLHERATRSSQRAGCGANIKKRCALDVWRECGWLGRCPWCGVRVVGRGGVLEVGAAAPEPPRQASAVFSLSPELRGARAPGSRSSPPGRSTTSPARPPSVPARARACVHARAHARARCKLLRQALARVVWHPGRLPVVQGSRPH